MTWLDTLHPGLVAGLQLSLSLAALIALVLVIRKPFASTFGAKASYMLWLLPVARLAAAPFLPGQFSLFGFMARESEPETSTVVVFERIEPAAMTWTDATITATVNRPEVPSTPVSVSFEPMMAESAGLDWTLILFAAWLAGALAFFGWAVFRQIRFDWLARMESSPAAPHLQREMDALRRELGVRLPVQLRTSLLCGGPLVYGLARPTVLVPDWFESDYTPAERRHALVHELMHVKRGDLWALQTASLFRAVQWFNPLAHVAVGAFRSDQEAACDADVLTRSGSSPHDYGRTLVKTVSRSAIPQPVIAGLSVKQSLKERLIHMQRPLPSRTRRFFGASVIALAGSAALLATAQPEPPKAPEAPPEATEAPKPPKAPKATKVLTWESDDGEKTKVIELEGGYAPADGEPHVLRFSGDGARIIFLRDPMADVTLKLETEIQPRLQELQAQLELIPMPNLEGLDEKVSMAVSLAMEEMTFDFISDGEFGGQITVNGQTFKLPEEEEAFEAAMEAFEVKMEAFEIEMEDFEARIEAEAEAYEVRVEVITDEMERLFEDEFEFEMDSAAETFEALVEACEDYDGEEPMVVEEVNEADGKTYKAICVSDASDAPKVRAFVARTKKLTAEEKAILDKKAADLDGGQ